MNNLLTAIYNKTSDSDLSSDVGGRIFLDQAQLGTEFPYVVFFIVSAVPDNAFAQDGEDILIQFSLFSASKSATEITTMYGHLKALFDDCSLTIPPTGTVTDALVWMRRDSLATLVDEVTTEAGTLGVKAWHVDYTILTQEA